MNSSIGSLGEDGVSEWLQRRGFRVLCRNYHSRYAEVDTIAADDYYLLFVEGKTRAERLIQTARLYLQANPVLLQPRFDVAAVITAGNPPYIKSIDYLENAFGERGF